MARRYLGRRAYCFDVQVSLQDARSLALVLEGTAEVTTQGRVRWRLRERPGMMRQHRILLEGTFHRLSEPEARGFLGTEGLTRALWFLEPGLLASLEFGAPEVHDPIRPHERAWHFGGRTKYQDGVDERGASVQFAQDPWSSRVLRFSFLSDDRRYPLVEAFFGSEAELERGSVCLARQPTDG